MEGKSNRTLSKQQSTSAPSLHIETGKRKTSSSVENSDSEYASPLSPNSYPSAPILPPVEQLEAISLYSDGINPPDSKKQKLDETFSIQISDDNIPPSSSSSSLVQSHSDSVSQSDQPLSPMTPSTPSSNLFSKFQEASPLPGSPVVAKQSTIASFDRGLVDLSFHINIPVEHLKPAQKCVLLLSYSDSFEKYNYEIGLYQHVSNLSHFQGKIINLPLPRSGYPINCSLIILDTETRRIEKKDNVQRRLLIPSYNSNNSSTTLELDVFMNHKIDFSSIKSKISNFFVQKPDEKKTFCDWINDGVHEFLFLSLDDASADAIRMKKFYKYFQCLRSQQQNILYDNLDHDLRSPSREMHPQFLTQIFDFVLQSAKQVTTESPHFYLSVLLFLCSFVATRWEKAIAREDAALLFQLLQVLNFKKLAAITSIQPNQECALSIKSAMRFLVVLNSKFAAFDYILCIPYLLEQFERKVLSAAQKISEKDFHKCLTTVTNNNTPIDCTEKETKIILDYLLSLFTSIDTKIKVGESGFVDLFTQGRIIYMDLLMKSMKFALFSTEHQYCNFIQFLLQNVIYVTPLLVASIFKNESVYRAIETTNAALQILPLLSKVAENISKEQSVTLFHSFAEYLTKIASPQKKLVLQDRSKANKMETLLILYSRALNMQSGKENAVELLKSFSQIHISQNPIIELTSIVSVEESLLGPPLQSKIIEKVSGLCQTFDLTLYTDSLIDLVQIITKRAQSLQDKSDPIGSIIIRHIISHSNQQSVNITFENIMENYNLWISLLEYPFEQTSVVELFQKAHSQIHQVCEELLQSRVTLAKAKFIIGTTPQTNYRICKLASLSQYKKASEIHKNQIDSQKRALDIIEKTAANFQVVYRCFFSNEMTDASELKQALESVQDEEKMMVSQCLFLFSGFPFFAKLDLMVELASSEIVISFWNKILHEEAAQSEKKLIQQVFTNYFPILEDKIKTLRTSIDSKSISFRELQVFEPYSEDKVRKEMRLLYQCTSKRFDLPFNSSSILENAKLVNTYLFVSKKKDFIPSLLSALKAFQKSFASSVTDDKYYKQLAISYDMLVSNWDTQKLDQATSLIKRIEENLQLFSEKDLELLKILSDGSALLDFLFANRNTREFNEKIRVSRGALDDAILLSSFACLQIARDHLQGVLYPAKLYASIQEFAIDFKNLNSKLSDQQFEERKQEIATIKKNLEMVIDAISQKLSSQSLTVCYQVIDILENYLVGINSTQSSVWVEDSKKNKKNLEELLDMRLTVLNSKIPEEVVEKYSNFNDEIVPLYCSIVSCISKLKNHLVQLTAFGHLDYCLGKGYQANILIKSNQETLFTLEKDLANKVSHWKLYVNGISEQHYFINYFNMQEVVTLIKCIQHFCDMKLDESAQECKMLIQFFTLINRKTTISDIQSAILLFLGCISQRPSDVNHTEWILQSFATTLSSLFAELEPEKRPIFRDWNNKNLSVSSNIISIADRKQERVIIIPCEEKDVANVILSVYVQSQSRLPEAEELFICTEETNVEDVLLLLRRWKDGARYKRADRIFTLANVHVLDYTSQTTIVDALHSCFPCKDTSATLVIISAKAQQQKLVSAFSSYIFEGVSSMKDAELKHIYEIISKQSGIDDGGLLVFHSNLPGSGKTTSVMSYCHKYKEIIKYAKIPLRETIDTNELIANLNSKLIDGRALAFHFDIAPSVSFKANLILFELITVGCKRDYKNCSVFHKRDLDCILIEIPCSPGNKTETQRLNLVQYLPRIQVEVNSSTLRLEEYSLTLDSEINKRERNTKLQYVCKYLRAYEQGRFKNSPQDYFPDSDADLSAAECYQLLNNFCKNPTPSFALFRNFIEFVYPLFVDITEAQETFLSSALFMYEAVDLKHDIISLLLETSKDFAVRNISLDFKEDVSLEVYANRLQTLRKWEDSYHPVVVFKRILGQTLYGEFGEAVQGLDIISTDPRIADRFLSSQVQDFLVQQGMNIKFNFKEEIKSKGITATEKRCVDILKQVANIPKFALEDDYFAGLDETYVLTEDNLLKMIAINLRFQRNIPVIINGESGIGKTSVLQFMCKALNYNLLRTTIHGGIVDADIIRFMRDAVAKALLQTETIFVVFLDECNTCNSMGLLKEILCDRSLDGIPLPHNIKTIACINPYRIKSEKSKDVNYGLVYKYYLNDRNIPDPLDKLVYRVYPLPDSFSDFIFDFGALGLQEEKNYIASMLEKSLGVHHGRQQCTELMKQVINLIELLLYASQQFVRKYEDDTSAASLRDISRCIHLIVWLDSMSANAVLDIRNAALRTNSSQFYPSLQQSIILPLCLVYYSRLDRQARKEYLKMVEGVWKSSQLFTTQMDFSVARSQTIVLSAHKQFTQNMNVDAGIALNESLCENVFVLLVSILNKLPCIVVGSPGASKSLSISLIAQSLRGKSALNLFCKSFPAVEVFSYQCSPLSKAQGISSTFSSARSYALQAKRSLCVVLLDEIGLAEQSPYLPLKILHKELETNDVAVVAISNFTLDAAKMNRCIFLHRSPPTLDDLKQTCRGIVNNVELERFLDEIALSFQDIYRNQKKKEFFGLRDMYSMVKMMNAFLLKDSLSEISRSTIQKSVLRNFGGRPKSEVEDILKTFEQKTKMKLLDLSPLTIPHLIVQNLNDKQARHLMLLTENNAALSLIFDLKLVDMVDTDVIFGSDFPEDQTNYQISLDLQKIKLAMAEGRKVVLIFAENLYESLYDLLNQHYQYVEGKAYARLAFGSTSTTNYVHPNFRLIIITEISIAYERLAAPLLNRLEKQVLIREELLKTEELSLRSELRIFVEQLKQKTQMKADQIFVGSHSQSLESLIQTLTVENVALKSFMDLDDIDEDEDMGVSTQKSVSEIAKYTLLQTASAEAIIRSNDPKLIDIYFHQQSHTDLETLLQREYASASAHGLQLLIQTYSSSSSDLEHSFKNIHVKLNIPCKVIFLDQFRSSLDLYRSVDEFLSQHLESTLVVVCETQAITKRRIKFAQFTCETRKFKLLHQNPFEFGKKHIIFTVHQPRLAQLAEKSFVFDYDKRWKYLFLDDLSRYNTSMPSIIEMCSASLPTLIQERKINLHQLLKDNLHQCVARLLYPFNRTASAIQQQLTTLEQLLDRQDVFTVIQQKLVEAIQISSHYGNHSMLSWFVHMDERTLILAGTFRRALDMFATKIVHSFFTCLVSLADKYSNLRTFFNSENENIWLQCFSSLIDPQSIEFLVPQLLENGMIEVRQEDRALQYSNIFPFSYLVGAYCYGTKALIENSNIDLSKQLQMISASPIFQRMSTNQSKQYLMDYMQIFEPVVTTAFSINLVFDILVLESRDKLTEVDLSLVQLEYWKNQSRLKAYLSIYEVFSSTVNLIPVIQKLVSESTSRLEIDLKLVSYLCSQLLDPLTAIDWDDLGDTDVSVQNHSMKRKWNHYLHQLKLYVENLISNDWFIKWVPAIEQPHHIQQLQLETISAWKKLVFFEKFVKELVAQDKVGVETAIDFWKNFDQNQQSYLSEKALLLLLETLTSINKNENRKVEEEEIECQICYELPKNIRRMNCCKSIVCQACLQDYLGRNCSECFWCRKPISNNKLEEVSSSDNIEKEEQVQEAVKNEEAFITSASKIIESFIVDFLFGNITHLPASLLQTIIWYVMEDEQLIKAQKKILRFIVLDSLRNSVLRHLIAGSIYARVREMLETQLQKQYNLIKCLDFKFATVICQIFEDIFEHELSTYETNWTNSIIELSKRILTKDAVVSELSILERLQNMAFAKVALRSIVSKMTPQQQFDSHFVECINSILARNERCVIYLLREIITKKGIVEMQRFCKALAPQFRNLEKWIHQNSEQLTSFFQRNLIAFESQNGFVGWYQEAPQFSAQYQAMQLMNQVITGVGKVSTSIEKAQGALQSIQNPYFAFLSFIEALYIPQQLQEEKLDNDLQRQLVTWCDQSTVLKDFKLICKRLLSQAVPVFSPSIWKVISHSIFALNNVPFFQQLWLSPQQLQNKYFPSMPEDIRFELRAVFGNNTGNWYECPNGHSYFVGECGKPMQQAKCPYCSSDIGGQNHNMVSSNRLIGNNLQDSTMKNYCLKAVELDTSEVVSLVVRTMNPISVVFCRFLMHSVMLLGVICKHYDYKCIMDQQVTSFGTLTNEEDRISFLNQHLVKGWNEMKTVLTNVNDETLSILLCGVIKRLSEQFNSQQRNIDLQSKEQRQLWEQTFVSTIQPIFETREQTIQQCQNRLTEFVNNKQKQVKDDLSTELLSEVTIEEINIKKRDRLLPSIWMTTPPTNWQTFKQRAVQQVATNPNFSVLNAFLETDTQLECLKYLPDVLKLCHLMCVKYNKRISRQNAREMCFEDVIDSLREEEKPLWSQLFVSYTTAFNQILPHMKQIECLELTESLRNVKIDRKHSSIVFMMPNREQEGLLALGFITYLCNLHNELLDKIQQDHAIISSKDVIHSLCIEFSIQNQLLPFVKDHAIKPLTYLDNREVIFNFELLQEYLLDHILIGKPKILLEIQLVDFLGEARGSSDVRARLKQKVRQVEVSKQVKTAITSIAGERARQLHQMVEMAMQFLASSGNQNFALSSKVANRYLFEYLETDLLKPEATNLLGNLKEHIQLKHLDSLWVQLEHLLTADIFSDVDSAYKQKLPEKLEEVLRLESKRLNWKNHLDVFTAGLLDFIRNFLTSSSIKATAPLSETIGLYPVPTENGNMLAEDVVFNDLPWFSNANSQLSKIAIAHAVPLYQLLKEIHSAAHQIQ